MTLALKLETRRWPRHEPFVIARSTHDDVRTVLVTIVDEQGNSGRGEACGVDYAGETEETMLAQLEGARSEICGGVDRAGLLDLLPAGGARFAVDSALWDLEAKQSGVSAFSRAGFATPRPIATCFTIGIRQVDEYRAAAAARAEHRYLKLKVDGCDPLGAIESAREGAPDSAFIVDPNQSWSIDQLKALAPRLAALGVVMLEQPIAVGAEPGLDGYRSPVALCADELINSPDDLSRVVGRFGCINIKLDKAGGLTAGLLLADAATALGLDLMVGCMGGSSLSMAPAMVLAQRCRFADLDGPLLQAEDWDNGLHYADGEVWPPSPIFWG